MTYCGVTEAAAVAYAAVRHNAVTRDVKVHNNTLFYLFMTYCCSVPLLRRHGGGRSALTL